MTSLYSGSNSLVFCLFFNKVQKCNLSLAFIFIRQSGLMARETRRGKKVSELYQDLKGNR